jgi:hypothetical protein
MTARYWACCAVCRKAQLLDLDRLQVDPHLDVFVRKLEQQGAAGTSTSTVVSRRQPTLACWQAGAQFAAQL